MALAQSYDIVLLTNRFIVGKDSFLSARETRVATIQMASYFQNSSTGTRSRSATPDSLDSISPPRTPPDPGPQNWVDSSSRASLDSGKGCAWMCSRAPNCSFGHLWLSEFCFFLAGHHSFIMSPSSVSPTSPPSSSPQHLESPLEGAPPRKQESRGVRRQLTSRFSPPNVEAR